MIRPALQDEAFLVDVEATPTRPDRLDLWWLGQSGYLVSWNGHRILLDPYLSDSLTRKYASTDKPHVRMTERVVDPARLQGISWVTASHVHTDHLDPETLGPLAAGNSGLRLVFPEAIRAAAVQRSGLPADRLVGLDAAIPGVDRILTTSDSADLAPGIRIRAVPAAHETLETDAHGRLICLGYVLQMGPWVLYHSGDTVLYPGQDSLLLAAGVDVAFLPINGRTPERRVSGNLWGDEAARLAKGIQTTVAIPGHYDLFKFNTATTERFVMACQQAGQGFAVLRAGERWTAPPPRRAAVARSGP